MAACSLFHSGFERTLSLPMQVSTMIRLPCDSMISAWMAMRILPFWSEKTG